MVSTAEEGWLLVEHEASGKLVTFYVFTWVSKTLGFTLGFTKSLACTLRICMLYFNKKCFKTLVNSSQEKGS